MSNESIFKNFYYFLYFFLLALFSSEYALSQVSIPSLELNLKQTDSVDGIVPAVKIIGLLTVLSVAPAILLMMTSFTRILIVLSFVRQAIGSQTMPPNQVILGLSLFLTVFTMSPLFEVINKNSYTPYIEKKISQDEAISEFIQPVRKFLLSETRKDDIAMFYKITNTPSPSTPDDVPMTILLPSFMISELKTAFQMGFLVYIPFLIIDMVVSSVLMAMGMMMLPPTVISLPFKLILFVLADGWSMIVNSLVRSFQIYTT